MTYTIKTALGSDKLAILDNLKSEVDFVSNSIRLGVNNFDNLSKYEFSKWKTWNRNQRADFKSCFDAAYIDQAVIGWFLNFPANTGFLDTMDAWTSSTAAGTIIAYSLTDQNSIVIEQRTVTLNRGEGIEFPLQLRHAVSISQIDRNWACLMLMK